MWVIFFQDKPHFWLIGGESYRVGKKDCHIIFPDDRSISRTHLTIVVAAQSFPGASTASECIPQGVALVDSSTYGTTITACGEEAEDADTLDDTSPPRGGDTTGVVAAAGPPVLETGIFGLCYSPAAAAAVVSPDKGGCRGSSTSCRASQPSVKLTKDVPCHVPVHRRCWHRFGIQLGHRGAELTLVWVDVSVLCEDVDIESQAKLLHVLRCCGVRQETIVGGNEAVRETETQMSPGECLRCDDVSLGRTSSAVTVLGSSGHSVSPQTTTSAAVSATPSPTAVVAAAGTGATAGPKEDPAPSPGVASCYNTVSFLVTSTVQPSTAVVAMLCRAVPIVTPSFFEAICNRASPQIPLPDPTRYLPPLSSWWCDLLAHIIPSADELHHSGGGAEGSRSSATVASSTGPSFPVAEVAETTGHAAATAATAAAHLRYFAPQPQRRRLFDGITFILLQWPLYEEVLNYLDQTGARVVWGEGGIHSLSPPLYTSSSRSQPVLDTLQSFFLRHQRHVLLYNESEPLLPWPGCVDVVRHGLSLCSVEYGALIEAIVAVRPLQLPAFPEDAQMPQTLEEVRARVAAATAESTSPTIVTEQEGRRTDAGPLFPELGGGNGASHTDSLPSRQASAVEKTMSDTRAHRRPRKEDSDGWVCFEKPDPIIPVPRGGHSSDSTVHADAAARTVEVHVGPFSLPAYPCFENATIPSLDASADGAAVVGWVRGAKRFLKQTLPPAEPLVELEENRSRRQLAASMRTACVPTVDAEGVVPEQVVMGCGGLARRVLDAANAAFNAFDTAAHHESSRRRGTVARRRGRGGTSARPAAAARATAGRAPRGGPAGTRSTDKVVLVDDDEDFVPASAVKTNAEQVVSGSVTSVSAADSSVFHIFDIDDMDSSYKEPSNPAVVTSYAVLSLPSKATMRRKGYNPDDVNYNGGLATHPLATWKTFSLPAGCSYRDAVLKVQAANAKPWGPVKIRLNFSDGRYEQFERAAPSVVDSFQSTSSYGPNDVFKAETRSLATTRRAQQLPRLRALVDERGHHLSSKPIPRTFAPQELYKNSPPPVLCQPGYDFTPISYNSFLLNPQDPPHGVRDVRSNFMHSICDYRPRSYLRQEWPTGAPHASRHCHCNEVFQVGDYTMDFGCQGSTVDHRNRLVTKEYSSMGTLKSNSSVVGRRHARKPRFECSGLAASESAGAAVAPSG